MQKVLKIGITKKSGDKILSLNSAEAIQGKGILNDRKFSEKNSKERQITLIEIENINFYNNLIKSNISPLDFRRNIITENIKLNSLIGKEFFVGKVKLKAHDLCRPCKYLQEKLNQNNLVKEFLHKGGLRCEILTSGEIVVGDIIRKADD
tara:strand:+ start:65 stop:514 length:450 start_codon:yes stop_codon:yes gene_type:complete